MARALRIEYPGAWYHVMNRGAGRRIVFPDDRLRRKFLELIGDVHERYEVRCHAYCLMRNHYHLLLHTPNGGLARAMRHVDGVYTQRHNRALQTDGPLFRGRYKAQLVENGDYLWAVSRYIHRNPVEAGLCGNPMDYEWSSYRFFGGEAGAPGWLYLRRTLAQFRSRSGYQRFVESGDPESVDDSVILSCTKPRECPPILGSNEFVDRMLQTVQFDYEIPPSRPERDVPLLEPMMASLCNALGWSTRMVYKAGDKTQRHRRALIMAALHRGSPATLKEIGALFGIHYSTAASAIVRCRRAAQDGSDGANELARIGELLRKIKNGKT